MSEITLHEAAHEYIEHLRSLGKAERTLYTYGRDFDQIEAYFGSEKKLSAILIPHVSGFLKSDALLKLPNGKERSEPTVKKTIRVLRMFLVWSQENDYITKLPLPKNISMGHSVGKGTATDTCPNHIP